MTDRDFNPDDGVIDRLEIKDGIVPGLDIPLAPEPVLPTDDETVLPDEHEDPLGVDIIPEPDIY